MGKYLSKYKLRTIFTAFVFIVVIPMIINQLFKLKAPCDFFVAKWQAADVLAFYGTMLASVTTILGVYISIEYAQRNYRVDAANRVKPYLSLTHYDSESKSSFGVGISADKSDVEQGAPTENYYKEYKVNKVYIIIDPTGIQFRNKPSSSQQRRLESGGLEWHNYSNGSRVLKAHPFISIPFDVENVGSGAAINTMIAFYKKGEKRRGASLYTVKQGDSFYFHVFCDDADSIVDNEYVIELIYGDIIGNDYSQKYPVQFRRNAETGQVYPTINLAGKQEIEKSEIKEYQNEAGSV